jgi:hypothetical protein
MRMRKQSVKWVLRMTFKLILLLHFERFTIMRLGSRLSNRGFTLRLPVAAPCVFSAKCPDRFWGPPTHLLNGTGRGLKLATCLHLEPWLRKKLYLHSPIHRTGAGQDNFVFNFRTANLKTLYKKMLMSPTLKKCWDY